MSQAMAWLQKYKSLIGGRFQAADPYPPQQSVCDAAQ